MADVIVEKLVTQLVFEGDVSKANEAIGTLGGLAEAVFLANSALAGLAASTAQDIARFQRLGESLGLGTQGAREMAAVFQITGAEINDVSDALQTLSDYSLEAQKGTESFVEAFGQVGVAASDLRGLKPDQILEVLADGMARTEDVTKRAATASQLLGDDVGRKLLPLLIRGADGIRDLREEARIYGGVVSEEAAAASQELTTDLRRLRYVADGLRIRLGIALIPVLHDVTDGMLDWLDANREWLDEKIGHGVDALTHAFRALTSPLGLAVTGIGGLLVAVRAAKAMRDLATAVGITSGLGFALTPLVGAAGLLVLTYAVVEDLISAASGGPSVFADWADSMGVESEFRASLAATVDLIKAGYEFTAAFDAAVLQLASDIGGIALAPFKQIVDAAQALGLLPSSFVAPALGGIEGLATSGAGLLRSGASAIQDNGLSGLVTSPVASVLGAGSSALGAMEELGVRGRYPGAGGVSVGSITVHANGLTAAEAEHLALRVVQEAVTESYDTSQQGTR